MGTLLDNRYEIMRHIGDGGMGAVYEARHVGTSRRVAIKVVHRKKHDDYQEMVERFQREARAGGAVNSPHIAQVFDAGYDAATACRYIAMEYLEGIDVATVLTEQATLDDRVALRIIGQCCAGLIRAHAAGIIHRDLKPSNIFLCRREFAADQSTNPDMGDIIVKLVDFGIAKLSDDLSEGPRDNLTQTGGVLGSPRYMSPEQAQGLKTIDHRSDIWSLGVTLYEMLCGRTPTQHEDTFGRILLAICAHPAPRLNQFASGLPDATTALVHRCLKLAPDDRPQTARALLDDIHHCLPDGLALCADDFGDLADRFESHPTPRTSGVDLDAFTDTVSSRAEIIAGKTNRSTVTAVTAGTDPDSVTEATRLPTAQAEPAGTTTARQRPQRTLILGGFGIVALGIAGVAMFLDQNATEPSSVPASVAAPSPPEVQTARATTAVGDRAPKNVAATPSVETASPSPTGSASAAASTPSPDRRATATPKASRAMPKPAPSVARPATPSAPTAKDPSGPAPKKSSPDDFGQFGPGF